MVNVPDEQTLTHVIGRRVKELRARKELSLRDLSARAGVSAAMISELERGAKSPTIAVISAIAHALDIPLSQLVDDEASVKRMTVMRRDEHRAILEANGASREHLGPTVHSSEVEFVRVSVPPGVRAGVFAPHAIGALERLHVDRGSVTVQAGDDAVSLEPGDSLVFIADRPHAITNVGSTDAVLYCVIEP